MEHALQITAELFGYSRADRALYARLHLCFPTCLLTSQGLQRRGEGRRVGQGWLVQQHGYVIKDNNGRLKKDDCF